MKVYMYVHSVAMCSYLMISLLGDTILIVNGHSVNLDNIDSVLAGLSNEVCKIPSGSASLPQ